MSIYDRKTETPEPGEWEVDEDGKRFRRVGNIIEYEMMISVAGGIEIPESELGEYHRRQKEAEEKRKAAALEELKNRPEPKSCPLSDSCNNTCKREGCNIFLKGKCSIATIADASGVEIEEAPAQNSKCPFSIYGRCQGCALYNKGCAIVRIAAATYKE